MRDLCLGDDILHLLYLVAFLIALFAVLALEEEFDFFFSDWFLLHVNVLKADVYFDTLNHAFLAVDDDLGRLDENGIGESEHVLYYGLDAELGTDEMIV